MLKWLPNPQGHAVHGFSLWDVHWPVWQCETIQLSRLATYTWTIVQLLYTEMHILVLLINVHPYVFCQELKNLTMWQRKHTLGTAINGMLHVTSSNCYIKHVYWDTKKTIIIFQICCSTSATVLCTRQWSQMALEHLDFSRSSKQAYTWSDSVKAPLWQHRLLTMTSKKTRKPKGTPTEREATK